MVAVDAAYCPRCGTALDRRPIDGRERRVCPACERVVWRNAVPGAVVAVVDDGRVLLIRRDAPPDAGRWSLPGGHAEADEPLPEAAARELREEVGLRVDSSALDPVATNHDASREDRYAVTICFRVDRAMTTGTPRPASDAGAVAFVGRVSDRDVRPHARPLVRAALRS